MKKTCYIVNFYLGDRRNQIEKYSEDKLCYVKSQIETLQKYKHSLSKIVFNFNVEKEHYGLLSESINLIPMIIQQTEIEINVRDNYGMSYGGWSDIFVKYQSDFDYYIFNEDDYVIVQDNFDEYLVNKFNSLPNCGYLCGLVRDFSHYEPARHAGMSSGISSYNVLKKVFDKYGELPHAKGKDYMPNEKLGQAQQTIVIRDLGYEIYDIREEFRLKFWGGNDGIFDTKNGVVNIHFMWQTKDLFLPSKEYFKEPHTWVDRIDKEYLRMDSDYNSENYYKY